MLVKGFGSDPVSKRDPLKGQSQGEAWSNRCAWQSR